MSRPSDTEINPQQPSTIASYLLVFAKALENKGIDSQALFARAGINETIGNDPCIRVPHAKISEVFRLAVEATGDPCFGLYASGYMRPGHIHALGTALLSSSTLLEYCQRIERFGTFLSKSADFFIEEQDEQIRFGCRIDVVQHPERAEIGVETQDVFWCFVLRLMRDLYRTDFNPIKVELIRPEPDVGGQAYLDFFQAPVSFGCNEIAYTFDRHSLEKPLPTASKQLAQMNDQVMTDYLAQIDQQDIVAKTTQLIIELMPAAKASKEEVASRLNMSPRTLQQKLAEVDTSYQTLCNTTRYQLACRYMENSASSLSDIAYLLGFTDLSSFSRAFKRWSGKSPREYRQQTH